MNLFSRFVHLNGDMTQILRGENMRKLILCGLLALAAAPALADDSEWVARSDEHAQLVLELLAKFSPEGAASFGVDGLDEEILDLTAGVYERNLQESREVLGELHKRHSAERHPKVKQDLEILIKAVEDSITSSELNRAQMLPYFNMSQTMFYGVRGLIDPQIPRERYPAAVTRMAKYAGIADGYEPIIELAKARTRERFEIDGLIGPYKGEVEQDLQRAETFITGIKEVLEGTDLEGWEDTYDTLAGQMRDYNEWLRAEILPRARDDYRLPVDLYKNALKNVGVERSRLGEYSVVFQLETDAAQVFGAYTSQNIGSVIAEPLGVLSMAMF